MNVAYVERRSGARVRVTRSAELRVARRVPARIVEISAEGTLVACDERFAPGTRGRLLVSLGTRFDAAVQIERTFAQDGPQALMGAKFVATNAENRAVLERFLTRGVAGN